MDREMAVRALVDERFGPPPQNAPRGKPAGDNNTHCGRWIAVPSEERYDWASRLVCSLPRDHDGAHHNGYHNWWWTDTDRTPRRRKPDDGGAVTA